MMRRPHRCCQTTKHNFFFLLYYLNCEIRNLEINFIYLYKLIRLVRLILRNSIDWLFSNFNCKFCRQTFIPSCKRYWKLKVYIYIKINVWIVMLLHAGRLCVYVCDFSFLRLSVDYVVGMTPDKTQCSSFETLKTQFFNFESLYIYLYFFICGCVTLPCITRLCYAKPST